MKKLLTSIFAMTLVAGLAACGGNPTVDSTNPTAAVQTAPDGEAELEPTSLGDFSAQDFQGNPVTKEIFSDYDLTMVNLWATTCSYCVQEMPALEELRGELQSEGKRFNIISICMDVGNTDEIDETNLAAAREIIEETGVTYLSLIPDRVLLEGRLNGIQAFPESFFVDRDGNVVSEPYVGALTKNHWRVTIQNELDKLCSEEETE